MFKRSTKITSLLVAAASVATMTPAMAADVQRVASEDGKVYSAIAYKDGNFYVDGEVQDDEQVYHYANGKFNKIDNLDSDSDAELYGEKYVRVDDGAYYVDLTSGKVTDEDIKENDEDDAASALRKKIKDKTDDRFDETDADGIKTLTLLSGAKYGENYYQTSVLANTKKSTSVGSVTVDGKNAIDVYTDAKGNYIDADYNLGKIKVETTDDSVNVENTKDSYKLGKEKDVVAKVSNSKYLTQDEKYIYRKATITISSETNDLTKIFGIDVTAGIFKPEGKGYSVDVIQKISKAQASDDVDGVKYAKDVTNYVIGKEKGEAYEEDSKKLSLVNDDKANFTVANGKLVAYAKDGDKLNAMTVKFAKKQNLNYTDLQDIADQDCTAYDTDVDGNLWVLDSGNIYKFNNDDDWDKVYRVDGAMDKLSVYNKDNIAAWEDDGDVYSLIGKQEKTPDPVVDPVKEGWNQAADGTWTFLNADGNKVTGWLQDGLTWYYLDPTTGVMKTGWVQSPASGKWYYMAGSGALQTGWINDNGTWYYCDASGAMQTGWVNDNGTWYYCSASGAMLSNTVVDGYVLGGNGAWIK